VIRAILLIPADGDPHGLLAAGPCGARPPVMWNGRVNGGADVWQPHPGTPGTARYDLQALVLAWDGEVVPVGCLLATRPTTANLRTVEDVVGGVLSGRWTTADLRGVLRKPGTALVCLDADGREVVP